MSANGGTATTISSPSTCRWSWRGAHPPTSRRLHASAAQWFEDEGDVGAAVRHWLAADEVARAAAVVGRTRCSNSARSGHVETVRRWLELFSDEQIQGDVPLTLVCGLVYSMSGDARMGRLWMDTALGKPVDDTLTPDGGTTMSGLQALLRAIMGADGLTSMREGHRAGSLTAGCRQPTGGARAAGTQLGFARWLSGGRGKCCRRRSRRAELPT